MKKVSNNMFSSGYLKEQKFTSLDLPDFTLKEKEFYKCSFEICNLSKAKFHKCRFEDCDFINCDLSLAGFKMSEFIDVRFNNSKLLGINWTDAESPLRIELRKCKLDHSTFYGLVIKSIVIEDCVANEVDFTEANLSKANCSGTDFLGSKFSNTDLSYSNFSKAMNYDINPNYNKIKKAVFNVPEVLTLLQGYDIVIK